MRIYEYVAAVKGEDGKIERFLTPQPVLISAGEHGAAVIKAQQDIGRKHSDVDADSIHVEVRLFLAG